MIRGMIIHEILHALGFYHQQSSPDRDNHVEIIWKNIKSGKKRNFCRYTNEHVTNFGLPYDFISIMHYRSGDFSQHRGQTTIKAKDEKGFGSLMGEMLELSRSDILKINKMYGCNESYADIENWYGSPELYEDNDYMTSLETRLKNGEWV